MERRHLERRQFGKGSFSGRGLHNRKAVKEAWGDRSEGRRERVAASSTDETAADSSEQQVVSSKQQAVSSKQ